MWLRKGRVHGWDGAASGGRSYFCYKLEKSPTGMHTDGYMQKSRVQNIKKKKCSCSGMNRRQQAKEKWESGQKSRE